MVINPSGKVQEVLAGNLRLPAKCVLCGVGSLEVERVFLDIQTDLDEYGTIYFCLLCAGELGLAAGLTDTTLFNETAAKCSYLQHENEELSKALTQMGDLVENDILRYLSNRNDRTSDSVSLPSVEVSVVSDDDDELFDFYFDGDSSDDSDTVTGESGEGTESLEPSEGDGPDDINEPTDSNPPKSFVPTLEL